MIEDNKMALKDWKKEVSTPEKELWVHKKDPDKLVNVYSARAFGGKTVYVFFARLSEPKYVDEDEYGKNVFSKRFDKRPQAINEAMKFMRSH